MGAFFRGLSTSFTSLDQIDIEINGANDFRFTANTFAALSGSTITTDTIAETTAAAGVTIDGMLIKDGGIVLTDSQTIKIGTGVDDTISHDGTLTTWTHTTGDLLFDSTDVNDQIIFRVGTDTTATGIEFRNNSDAAMWNLRPASATAGTLKGSDASALVLGDGDDIAIAWDATKLAVTQAAANSAIHFGVSGAGIDLNLFGDTAGYDVTWDQSLDSLIFSDNAKLGIGSGAGAGADIVFSWDATRLNVTQLTANSEIRWGIDGAGIDQRWYGDTASAALLWDQSGDMLSFEGAASARGLRTSSTTAAAITGATTLTLADSGGVFSVSQAAAYDIDLPSPTTGPGCTYLFYLTGPAANNVTITVDAAAATFVGTIVNDVTSVLPATGSTLTFASGASALGDSIEITSISTGLYLVRAVSSAAGGITIA